MEGPKLNSGQILPSIGFGTWQLSPADTLKSVTLALHTGYRHIDTAKIYGNEAEVGEAILKSKVKRDEVFVTTKLWNSDQGYDSALKAFDESLNRLGLEYIDLYLIHWPGDSQAKRHDSWKALIEIQASGRAKSIGVSNFTVSHLQSLFDAFDQRPAVNQAEFHPFIYQQQKQLLDFCTAEGIIFEAYSPLAQGKRDDELLQQRGRRYDKSAIQVMLRWALQHGTVPLPRSANPDHIRENFDIFDFQLSADDMAAIDNIGQTGRTAWDPTGLP